MAGIFTIAPVNSLHFIRQDTSLPNFDNTILYDKPIESGVAHVDYHQRVLQYDTLTIQLKSDYTSITAYLYNIVTGAKASLTVTLKTTYTGFKFYEIEHYFNVLGIYKIFIDATLSGYANVHYVSEVFEVASSWDGVKIEYYNDSNTAYVDYSTDVTHLLRTAGNVHFSDVGGKEEFYNNFGVEERIYAENETIFELICEKIPYYLCQQLIYGGRLDHFFVNDCEYIVKEHSVDSLRGSHLFNLTLKLTKKEVYGINTDNTMPVMAWGASENDGNVTIASEAKTALSIGYIALTVSGVATFSGGGTQQIGCLLQENDIDIVGTSSSEITSGSSTGTLSFGTVYIKEGYTYNLYWYLI